MKNFIKNTIEAVLYFLLGVSIQTLIGMFNPAIGILLVLLATTFVEVYNTGNHKEKIGLSLSILFGGIVIMISQIVLLSNN